MRSILRKIKYRWKVAPTWVKMIDICCWITLLLVVIFW